MQAECATIEEFGFFGRTFDGVIAWGLIFLLTPDVQSLLIRKVARVLTPGGRFLFYCPRQAREWADALTRAHIDLPRNRGVSPNPQR